MAFIPPVKRDPITLNLTPMIDITFQLLVFFVCVNTWSYVRLVDQVGLDLPAPIATAQELTEADRPRVIVNLRPDGGVQLAGQIVDLRRLTEHLRGEFRRHAERLEVVVRADRQVPYGRTRAVFDACTAAGIPRVRFAVLREEP